MEYFATIVSGNPEDPQTETFPLSHLEAIRIIASRRGFHDLDLEPDVGVLKLTVRGNGMSVSVVGRSTAELARNLKERIG